jgi:hypothetical protein
MPKTNLSLNPNSLVRILGMPAFLLVLASGGAVLLII